MCRSTAPTRRNGCASPRLAHREQAALLRELTADEREQLGRLLHKLTGALMARAEA
jgi:hypothetical protein